MNKSSSFHYKTSRDPYSYFQIFSNIHFSEFINMYKRFPLRIHLIFRSLTKSFTEQRKEEREEVHRVCRVSP